MRALVVSSIAILVMLGAPAIARADRDDQGDRGEHGEGAGHHGDAPEPLTVIGLALGAGGIAVAKWASGRKSRNKQ
jgi:hypothetical protein